MTISEKFWTNDQKTPDLAFDALRELTLEASGLSTLTANEEDPATNRWLSLVYAWNEMLDYGASKIFLDAIHRCMWSFPYPLADSKYSEIATIVQYELLRDEEAFNAWNKCDELREALLIPVNGEDPWLIDAPIYRCTLHHYEHLATSMLYRVQYSKRKYESERAECVEAMEEYPNALSCVIPDLKQWPTERLIDERNIVAELKRLYGVDYSHHESSYQHLIDLLMLGACSGDSRIVHHASQIEVLPYSLAKMIWPLTTADDIEGLFLCAYWVATGYVDELLHKKCNLPFTIDLSDIRKSWLYTYLAQFSPDVLNEDTKSAFFDITMRT